MNRDDARLIRTAGIIFIIGALVILAFAFGIIPIDDRPQGDLYLKGTQERAQ